MTTDYRLTTKGGFSLIELLIVVVIIATIAAFLLSSLFRSQERQNLNAASDDVVSLVAEARSRTLAARNDSVWGVHFETERVVLFAGPTFSEGAPENKEATFPKRVIISDIDLASAGDDIIFTRLSGETGQYGTITISLENDSSQNKIITVSATGVVELGN